VFRLEDIPSAEREDLFRGLYLLHFEIVATHFCVFSAGWLLFAFCGCVWLFFCFFFCCVFFLFFFLFLFFVGVFGFFFCVFCFLLLFAGLWLEQPFYPYSAGLP